ncbi:three-helix bundle dimerization domain-containing protein [Kitasatospora sp. NPDC085879]|uniref:three-helix bundle dimerization domain-containing protein n=1 Tax=Kitasatospora sp. NPDC085879 TaxID=3154769 RepID=UPI0034469F71
MDPEPTVEAAPAGRAEPEHPAESGEPAEPGESGESAEPGQADGKERATWAAAGRRLHQRFDATAGAEAVDRALDEALHRFDGSRIRAFVPILAERIATDSLRSAADGAADGDLRGGAAGAATAPAVPPPSECSAG